MSPRRNHPQGPGRPDDGRRGQDERERESGFGYGAAEEWRGEEWIVRPIAGSASGKHYRCPGCDQEIPPGVGHVVAWREYAGVDDRRHWHRACWNAKDRRTSKVQRSRNGPRY
ncbi:ATP/GTP-binding protein [Streptomyces sp. NBC_01190]|uniref:ATP/GTP-binding protein n=1 Tax=Streptomyces sp. NBC_01190 TaxID=2903767 RepID=UPI00386CE74E|nr:ATP/GTP-binding protein [Streptomyces sp. NBC_01190]